MMSVFILVTLAAWSHFEVFLLEGIRLKFSNIAYFIAFSRRGIEGEVNGAE
jgi:hypothetical protein